jgi:hypothetical protein
MRQQAFYRTSMRGSRKAFREFWKILPGFTVNERVVLSAWQQYAFSQIFIHEYT